MKKMLRYFGGFVGLVCAFLLTVVLITGAMGVSFIVAYLIAEVVVR